MDYQYHLAQFVATHPAGTVSDFAHYLTTIQTIKDL